MGRKAKGGKGGVNLPPPYEKAVREEMARRRLSRSAVIQRAIRPYFGPLIALDEESAPDSEEMTAVPWVAEDVMISSEVAVPKVVEDVTPSSEMLATSGAHLPASVPHSTGQDRTATDIRAKAVSSFGGSRIVRAIPTVRSTAGSTTISGMDTLKGTPADPFSRDSERKFSKRAAIPWILLALQDQNETQDPVESPGDTSPITAQGMTHGSVRPRYMFPRGSIVRVRRSDGSTYLARVR
ncbi:MAG: hypothetical protein WCB19_10140 [Thermoplasmata archaeon]